jgi:hypothetical protein
MTLKPKKTKKIPLSAKIGNKKVELQTFSFGGISEHEVIISEGKKREIAFDRGSDLADAIRAWKSEVRDIASDYEDKEGSERLINNSEAVLTALKEVWEARGDKKTVTAHQIENHLTKRLNIPYGVREEVERALNRLEYEGAIELVFHSGLNMHGPGLGGDGNKRRIEILFRDR